LLQVKPILHFVDKLIVPFEKIRTRKKAIKRIIQLLEEDVNQNKQLKITIIHANTPNAAEDLKNKLLEKHSNLDISISYFGPVIGTHLGEGAIACAGMKKMIQIFSFLWAETLMNSMRNLPKYISHKERIGLL